MANTSFAHDYQLSYYSIEDGLSHNEVTSIVQDDYGFMWFGTRAGLLQNSVMRSICNVYNFTFFLFSICSR
ncbi:two-component regulator propeller domain-containing protein [Carboxylicivirga marina]